MTRAAIIPALLSAAACLALPAPVMAQPGAQTGTGTGARPHPAPISGQCQTALNGRQLSVPSFAPATQKRLDENIAAARAALAIAPDREDHHIWLGRHLDYAGRICEAVDAFNAGLAQFPNSYKLYRFRARDLTRARQFDAALADYETALRLMGDTPDIFEQDGLPNKLHLTISTYRGNIIYYHAQTSFATGDYPTVLLGMATSPDLAFPFARDDMHVPTAYWSYLALRKMGRHDEARALIAAVPDHLQLIENDIYYDAVKVMQKKIKPESLANSKDSTIKFAIAMEYRFDGQDTKAQQVMQEILAENPQGHWPSEVELAAPNRRTGW
jgi:tetratricopeptide (TPR) repeat protein